MEKAKSFFHVAIVVMFGILFITTISQEPVTTDPITWWWETCWSVFAICLGGYFAIYTDSFIHKNYQQFLQLYEKTGVSIFKHQAEGILKPHMYLFVRAMGILFVLTGLVLLFRNLFS
jgi:hypothetical protein